MIKYYCDLCKEEITKADGVSKYAYTEPVMHDDKIVRQPIEKLLCEKCGDKVKEVLK